MSSSVCFSACSSGRLLVLDMASFSTSMVSRSLVQVCFYIRRDIVKSSFESRIVVGRNIPGFSRSHPKYFMNLPLVP